MGIKYSEENKSNDLCFKSAKLDCCLVKQMLLSMSREQLKWGSNWPGLTSGWFEQRNSKEIVPPRSTALLLTRLYPKHTTILRKKSRNCTMKETDVFLQVNTSTTSKQTSGFCCFSPENARTARSSHKLNGRTVFKRHRYRSSLLMSCRSAS